jgi:hypothetical protein
MKPKLIHDLMRSFTLKDIENRSYRKTLLTSITLAFCSYHGIEHTDPDAMKALQYIHAILFDPLIIVMTEGILSRYSELDESTPDGNEIRMHFEHIGVTKPKNNVHNLADYVKGGKIN